MTIDLLRDPRVAAELIRTVDRRVEQVLEQRLPMVRYGMVSSVDLGARTCAVDLGVGAASPGYRLGSAIPSVGQVVRVVVQPTGDRYVDDVVSAAYGEAFPPSPAAGQRFYRSDRLLEYAYDGTRWLTLNQYSADLEIGGPYTANGATTGIPYSVLDATANGLWLTGWTAIFIATATNDASNFWTILLYRDQTFTVLDSFVTASFAAGVAQRYDRALAQTWGVSADNSFVVRFNKTGAPGGLYVGFRVEYRKVG